MINVNNKAQIMILDILILLFIVLLIINIEFQNIKTYNNEIKNSNQTLNELQNILLLDSIINNKDYLAQSNYYKNKIKIKNLDKLEKINVCYLKINKEYITKQKSNIYKRAVIYNNKFEILEVGFCE
jgi:hypothetical protein